MSTEPSAPETNVVSLDPLYGGLREHEYYWRDRQVWLAERGYMLRPRYKPDWKPSWLGTKTPFIFCEDSKAIVTGIVLDATRMSDGKMVMLKKVNTETHPHEVENSQFLSSEGFASDPRNHCVPLLDVLPDPEEDHIVILVLPLLRSYADPHFVTIGEVIACLQQLIRGLRFMHAQHFAHRDISILNVMMDGTPMYPDGWHPYMPIFRRDYSGLVKHFTRTQRPPKYFFIDFGLSRKYNPDDGPPLEPPVFGGDKSVPEFQGEGHSKPSNPFPTDVYYLGSFIREGFLERYRNVEFLTPLVTKMVQEDPEKRPTAEEVSTMATELFAHLSAWKLRDRVVERKETMLERTIFGLSHLFRTMKYLIMRLPALPVPPD